MGTVIGIIIVVALAGLVVYELCSFVISLRNKAKKKKKKNDDDIENVEKGND